MQEFFKEKLNEQDEYVCVGYIEKVSCNNVSEVYTYSSNIIQGDWWKQHDKQILDYLVTKLNVKLGDTLNKLQFAAHKSVVKNLQEWFWHCYQLVISKFGEEYVDEQLIYRLYFAMRNDLTIKAIQTSNGNIVNIVNIKRNNNQVSVIVTARNYGKFLKECLNSCFSQSVQPLEVIYSDDGSTDNSVNVAKRVDNVQITAHKHQGVCEARNQGVRVSKGNILIHVDGDDILTYTFIEKHLESLDKNPNAPFVYGPAQAFGKLNCLWPVSEWGKLFLWDQNFCNTSSAIRRYYFDAVGGWKNNICDTYWDWDLFLRLSRLNNPAPSEAILLYRQHDNSWSNKRGERSNKKPLLDTFRKDIVRLSVGCVYSGRLPGLLTKWLKSLTDNLKKLDLPNPIDLVLIDNSGPKHKYLYNETSKYSKYFESIKIIKLDKEAKSRNEVAELLAEAYTMLLQYVKGDLVFFLEDDITFITSLDLNKLVSKILEDRIVIGAISGAYRNRHTEKCPTNPWIAGRIENGISKEFQELPKEKFVKVDVAGTGCLLAWKNFIPEIIQPYFVSSGYKDKIPAHDWWLTSQITRNKLLATDVKLKHWRTDTQYV